MENIPEFLRPFMLKGLVFLYLKCAGKKCGLLMTLAGTLALSAFTVSIENWQFIRILCLSLLKSTGNSKFFKNVQLIFPQLSPLSV